MSLLHDTKPARQLTPRLLRHLAAIAGQRLPDGASDPLEVARHFNGGRALHLLVPEPAALVQADQSGNEEAILPQIDLLGDLTGFAQPADDPDNGDDADLALIVHLPGVEAAVTAAAVEIVVTQGRRVAVIDLSQGGRCADPALIPAINDTTVYISNLVAFDVDLRRAVATCMTPLRDGAAFRRYLADTLLTTWAWHGIVESEVRATFGDTIPPRWSLRAETQARSRLGAYLLKLRARGLRFFIDQVGFEDDAVDGFWFTLRAE